MTASSIAAAVAEARAYIATPKGRRNLRELMQGCGYSYERAIAEVVVYILSNCGNGRLRTITATYEDISMITDEVIIAELAPAEATA